MKEGNFLCYEIVEIFINKNKQKSKLKPILYTIDMDIFQIGYQQLNFFL